MTILQDVHQVLSENAELVGIAGFLAGTLVGNWIAIGRDKRQEFNEIVRPIRTKFAEIDDWNHHALHIKPSEEDLILSYLGWWKRRRFCAALKRYKQTRQEQQRKSNHGTAYFHDADLMRTNAAQVLSFLSLR